MLISPNGKPAKPYVTTDRTPSTTRTSIQLGKNSEASERLGLLWHKLASCVPEDNSLSSKHKHEYLNFIRYIFHSTVEQLVSGDGRCLNMPVYNFISSLTQSSASLHLPPPCTFSTQNSPNSRVSSLKSLRKLKFLSSLLLLTKRGNEQFKLLPKIIGTVVSDVARAFIRKRRTVSKVIKRTWTNRKTVTSRRVSKIHRKRTSIIKRRTSKISIAKNFLPSQDSSYPPFYFSCPPILSDENIGNLINARILNSEDINSGPIVFPTDTLTSFSTSFSHSQTTTTTESPVFSKSPHIYRHQKACLPNPQFFSSPSPKSRAIIERIPAKQSNEYQKISGSSRVTLSPLKYAATNQVANSSEPVNSRRPTRSLIRSTNSIHGTRSPPTDHLSQAGRHGEAQEETLPRRHSRETNGQKSGKRLSGWRQSIATQEGGSRIIREGGRGVLGQRNAKYLRLAEKKSDKQKWRGRRSPFLVGKPNIRCIVLGWGRTGIVAESSDVLRHARVSGDICEHFSYIEIFLSKIGVKNSLRQNCMPTSFIRVIIEMFQHFGFFFLSISINVFCSQVPIVSSSKCEEMASVNITANMICAGDVEDNKDSCKGQCQERWSQECQCVIVLSIMRTQQNSAS